MSDPYTIASLVADIRHVQAITERARDWLHAELTAAGLAPSIKPCTVSPDFESEGKTWKLVGTRSWCGDARLSSTRSLLVVVRETEVMIFCETYAGQKTYGSGQGPTVAAALADLLAQPRNGVPLAFLGPPRG